MRKKALLCILLLATASPLFAQSTSAAPATAAQQAAQNQFNQQMVKAALRVTQLVDDGKIGDIWDGPSPIAKSAVTRAQFIKQISADRAAMGALTSRTLYSITFSQSDGKSLPAGVYANIRFTSVFANAKAGVRELVSFHLESNKNWLVAGYTLH